MNEEQKRALYRQLLEDDFNRDRIHFDYTVDALMEGGIIPYAIWPEPNQNVANIISGQISYDDSPHEDDVEIHKGMMWMEQQDIILRNNGKEPLCEAQDLQPCLKGHCVIYNSSLGPPVCREFKMVFKR